MNRNRFLSLKREKIRLEKAIVINREIYRNESSHFLRKAAALSTINLSLKRLQMIEELLDEKVF